MNIQTKKPRGFTLTEVLLATAITALIGSAVSAMVFAVSYGTSRQQDMRTLVTTKEMASVRLNNALRASQMVLAQGNGYLALWTTDKNGDGNPNLSEVCRIELDQAGAVLYSYQAKSNMSPAQDTSWPLGSTDFAAVTLALEGNALFPRTAIAEGITSLQFTLTGTNCQNSRYVGYSATIPINGVTTTTVGGVALMNRK